MRVFSLSYRGTISPDSWPTSCVRDLSTWCENFLTQYSCVCVCVTDSQSSPGSQGTEAGSSQGVPFLHLYVVCKHLQHISAVRRAPGTSLSCFIYTQYLSTVRETCLPFDESRSGGKYWANVKLVVTYCCNQWDTCFMYICTSNVHRISDVTEQNGTETIYRKVMIQKILFLVAFVEGNNSSLQM